MLWLLLLGLAAVRPSQAQQTSLLNITAPYQNLSTTCISVLNQAVVCDSRVRDAGTDGRFESDETLAAVCTTTCASSLALWVRRVAGACGTSRYTSGQASLLVAFMAESVLENYSVLCLKNPQGQFCNAVFKSAILSATGAASTVPSNIACNSCAASMLSTRLQMPIGNMQTELQTQYAALTSSCKISGMSVTPLATTTQWVTMLPTTAPQCDGTMYTLKAGDNCRSVSLSQGIGTTNLLLANNLLAYCANFPTSGTLCIPTKKKCKPYQLKVDLSDTCRSIAMEQDASWAQIVSWNPEVGEDCENINRLAQAGQVLCASTPGGSWVNPYPDTTSDDPTTTQPETYFTLPPTDFASAPSPTYVAPYPMAGYVDPYANGTVLDCGLHRTPPVQVKNDSTSESSYLCSDFASFYGITIESLVEWNPSLATRMTGGDCVLFSGEQYCAQRDLHQGAGTTEYCVSLQVAEDGARSTCDGFVHWYGLSLASFLEWNPSLGATCENFRSGSTYCTSVRGFRPANTISTCTRWHRVTDVNPANNPCGTIETKYGLQHARFVAWNPSVQNDCSGIQLWYEYCVGTPQFPGTGG
ncbi:hypothetical protein GQ53DRAFT_839064 [Thozetella sp. PMI_491]|nr:hypothetical protein GQ53DRAFT_839064 [Thozetella sp. PMI_491]